MDAWLEVRAGARAGAIHRLAGEPVVAGRAAEAQLRLDPQRDLAVSGRHAMFLPTATGWTVRDMGSTNGTWVDDVRLVEDRALVNGDRIRLGAEGPVLVYHTSPPTATARSVPSPARHPERSRVAWIVAGTAVLALSSGTYIAGRLSTRSDWDRERATLEARMDSMLEVAGARTARMRAANDSLARSHDESVASLELRMSGLVGALEASEVEVRSLRDSLRTGRGDALADADVARLRRRLQEVSVALERQQLAASLDFAAIERATRRSVAQVYVQTARGVSSGTAFGVDPGGVLMTNHHVVEEAVRRPGRPSIGVQFADSRQVYPARIVAFSREDDLALLQVDSLLGTIPTVRGFNARADTLGAGVPVAIVGFPLGGLSPGGAVRVIRPLVIAGVTVGERDDLLELQGYGERGESGSPVLDRDGLVIGVLRGRPEDEDRRLVAVPARYAIGLLERR